MRGNLDRVIVGQRALIELKNCDAYVHRYSGEWGEDGSDEVPLRYLLQVVHYLAITRYELAYLIALVGGNNLVRYVIHRDLELEERVIEGERAFWTHVEKREPPALDYTHPSAYALMRRLFPGSDGRMITLPAEANEWHAGIIEAREEEKAAHARQEELKARMLEAMSGASIGRIQSGGEYRYSKVMRKGYEVAETEYQTLRFAAKQTRMKEVA
jgi:predicted phage-related endonuclease